MIVHMAVDLHALIDSLPLQLHVGAEIHPSHVFHQNVQSGPLSCRQVHDSLLQKLSVVQRQDLLTVQQDVRSVVCPPELHLIQPLLGMQAGPIQNIAVVLSQTLHGLGINAGHRTAQPIQHRIQRDSAADLQGSVLLSHNLCGKLHLGQLYILSNNLLISAVLLRDLPVLC